MVESGDQTPVIKSLDKWLYTLSRLARLEIQGQVHKGLSAATHPSTIKVCINLPESPVQKSMGHTPRTLTTPTSNVFTLVVLILITWLSTARFLVVHQLLSFVV